MTALNDILKCTLHGIASKRRMGCICPSGAVGMMCAWPKQIHSNLVEVGVSKSFPTCKTQNFLFVMRCWSVEVQSRYCGA